MIFLFLVLKSWFQNLFLPHSEMLFLGDLSSSLSLCIPLLLRNAFCFKTFLSQLHLSFCFIRGEEGVNQDKIKNAVSNCLLTKSLHNVKYFKMFLYLLNEDFIENLFFWYFYIKFFKLLICFYIKIQRNRRKVNPTLMLIILISFVSYI